MLFVTREEKENDMHDLDQTRLEFNRSEFDDDEFEFEEEFESSPVENMGESDFVDEDAEFESEYEYEYESEADVGDNSSFSEAEEMELAAELMEITSDEELEYFLGRLIKRGIRKVRKRIKRKLRGRLGRRLRRGLRKIAKRGLRFAGRAVGGAFGGPLGAAVGRAAGRGVGKIFGLELEGMSPEDQEFEAARQFIRLAGDATLAAVATPESVNDDEAAGNALKRSVVKFAPGLTTAAGRSGHGGKSGRWVRKGSRIILMGV